MAKPWVHAQSSVRQFGGKAEDYIAVHEMLDSQKAWIPDNRGRALTHNSWFIYHILPKIFGTVIVNSEGKEVSVSLLAERHVLEDYGMRFIPTPQDWLANLPQEPWMQNGMAFIF